jgi:hypothetical protein
MQAFLSLFLKFIHVVLTSPQKLLLLDIITIIFLCFIFYYYYYYFRFLITGMASFIHLLSVQKKCLAELGKEKSEIMYL